MVYTAKWKTVRIQREILEEARKEVEKGRYRSLSEFVSEAIRLRMQTLAKERVKEYLERDKQSRIRQLQGQLLYTPKHIWAKLTALGNLELGVSDYFESQLKGIVYVGDFDEGDNVSRDESFGVIETVAWWPTYVIHDLYSPIDGKIVRVNKDVLDDPYILNEEPYQWIVEVKPHDPELKKELDKLLSFEEYKRLVARLEERPRSPPSDSQLSEMIMEIRAR